MAAHAIVGRLDRDLVQAGDLGARQGTVEADVAKRGAVVDAGEAGGAPAGGRGATEGVVTEVVGAASDP